MALQLHPIPDATVTWVGGGSPDARQASKESQPGGTVCDEMSKVHHGREGGSLSISQVLLHVASFTSCPATLQTAPAPIGYSGGEELKCAWPLAGVT